MSFLIIRRYFEQPVWILRVLPCFIVRECYKICEVLMNADISLLQNHRTQKYAERKTNLD